MEERKTQSIGVIGLAVMGRNLALNIESRGYSVAVYNRTREKTDGMLREAAGRKIAGAFSIEEFISMLERPRKIIMMVRAGGPVDDLIGTLRPHLGRGDVLIDAGNSYYIDTVRRRLELEADGILYLGTGVSGGEEGALHGPSIMPGGPEEAYRIVEPVFRAIAADVGGEPCCAYIGPDGAGHYVKMVHNGIEYGDMQLIAEAYAILRGGPLGLGMEELHGVFADWNKGELDSYLIEITRDIMAQKDERTGEYLLDVILDAAGQKGTGKWGSRNALDLGVATPTITEAVFARFLSEIKDERVAASQVLKGPETSGTVPAVPDRGALIESVRRALYASKICSYAQGFALMRAASKEYGWDLPFGELARIWRGGCIIRAGFLQKIMDAYARQPDLQNLLLDEYFSGVLAAYQYDWRKTVCLAVEAGVPVPGFSSALAYYDAYRSGRLPANLLQAQRDYFGAHTYERTDAPRGEFFHTDWTGHGGATASSVYSG